MAGHSEKVRRRAQNFEFEIPNFTPRFRLHFARNLHCIYPILPAAREARQTQMEPYKRFRPERQIGSPAALSVRSVMKPVPMAMATGDAETQTDWFVQGSSTLGICLTIRNFWSHSKEKVAANSSVIKVKVVGGREQYSWVLTVTPLSRLKGGDAGDSFVGVNLVRRDSFEGKVSVKFKFSILGNAADQSPSNVLYEQRPSPYFFAPDGGCWPLHNFISHNNLREIFRKRRLQSPSADLDDTLVVRAQLEFSGFKISPPSLSTLTFGRADAQPLIIRTRQNSGDSGLESSPEHDVELPHKIPTSAPHSPTGGVVPERTGPDFRRRRASSSSSTISDAESLDSTKRHTDGSPIKEATAVKTVTAGLEMNVRARSSENLTKGDAVVEHITAGPDGLVSLSADMQHLYSHPISSDFTVISNDNKKFLVSRGILAGRSTRFREIFASEETLHEYTIPKFDSVVVDALLEFMYCGATRVPKGEVENLMLAACDYGVGNLAMRCEKIMTGSINEKNAVRFLIAADQLSLVQLRSHVLAFLRDNLDTLTEVDVCKLHRYKPDLLRDLYSAGTNN